MKHSLIFFILIFIHPYLFAQIPKAADYGVRHMIFSFESLPVDILIQSKSGEEMRKKPLFFFCQGSLPQPLLKYDEHGLCGIFPFNPEVLLKNYHLVIVGKPSVPLIRSTKALGAQYCFLDSLGQFPKDYVTRNLPAYYVRRNIAVIQFLHKQTWVDQNQLVVAGHSEGSTIAALMATSYKGVTQLIYSGGNPCGRILSIIEEARYKELDTDSTRYAEDWYQEWQKIVEDKTNMDMTSGDTYQATYTFSQPMMESLLQLKIPVLVSYGTADWSAPFTDYLRVEAIRKGKKNIGFKPYPGTDHNYFPINKDRQVNTAFFNWDRVASDWAQWLE